MGQALKLEVNSYWAALKSSLSRFYITKWKGFHVLLNGSNLGYMSQFHKQENSIQGET
ncbi:hypothetical protein KIN20_012422 [Parelaphostrongylus tenuis]|uniref:Uncharacterized protein n=1 Tax=Parelaphostrongylus tenuis TaxID=148309 RepID=A0AAD5MAP5_PARTN|nr:hypothetical protein KIN20_012422 [Parelaphostrongylus tenuis]